MKDQVNELTAVMKAGSFPKRNNPPLIGKNKGSKQSSQSRGNESQNGGNDIHTQLSGPETNASGPFAPGQRVIQCYKCKGWGHQRWICPSHLNFIRGNPKTQEAPLPSQELTSQIIKNPELTQ